jgi:CubicO group peptidase (beta-lactamase class C family)
MIAFRVFLGALTLAGVASTLRAQSTAPDTITRYVAAMMERQHVPGLALAVVRGGRLVRAEGFGFADRERRIAVTPRTVFKIGSVSKQFLATGIMLLVQDGRLGVDDLVSKYIAGTPDAWKALTIRDLLTHTSGVLREGPAFNPMARQPDIEVIRSAFAAPLQFETGTRYQYCNVCYFTLAEIIARVSGKPWSQVVRERIFLPSGMTASGTTADSLPGRSHGYDWRTDSLHHAPDWPALRPSGAFSSSVVDLAKWDSVLYTDAVLTRASKDQMWTAHRLKDGKSAGYGFGWSIDSLDGRQMVHHGGSLPGFRAQMTRIPGDSLTIIVLTNGDDARPGPIARDVARLVLSARRE